jgi:hypothetical protein
VREAIAVLSLTKQAVHIHTPVIERKERQDRIKKGGNAGRMWRHRTSDAGLKR